MPGDVGQTLAGHGDKVIEHGVGHQRVDRTVEVDVRREAEQRFDLRHHAKYPRTDSAALRAQRTAQLEDRGADLTDRLIDVVDHLGQPGRPRVVPQT